MDTAQKSLFEFERQVDCHVASLDVWRLPLRSVLSSLSLTVDGLITRGDAERAGSLVSQISLLCPFLRTCSLEIGASAEDALSVVGEQQAQSLRQLIVYGKFCELMPEVRHNHYDVAIENANFVLAYDNESQCIEEYDFALHEISKATDSGTLQTRSPLFGRLVQEWPIWDQRVVFGVLAYLYNHHLQNVHEQPLLPRDAYMPAFGFLRQEFTNVRAALFALASFANGLHIGAAQERDKATDKQAAAKYQAEFLEWNTPLLSKEFVYAALSRLTTLSRERVVEILVPFSLDAASGDYTNAGDGYLPPLILYEDSILFNPHAVRMMMHERNLLYVLNKSNKTHFNDVISRHLEPMLLREALREFSLVPTWLIERNFRWAESEIDLLVFDPNSNTGLQIQAKAAMPAQNARMTRQLEDHTLRAKAQIDKVRLLPASDLDALFSHAFRRHISNTHLISAVLSRSGVGTRRSWSALGDTVALNVPLLRETLRVIGSEPGAPLTRFPVVAVNILNDWARRVVRGWRRPTISLLDRRVSFPVIEMEDGELSKIKVSLGLVQ